MRNYPDDFIDKVIQGDCLEVMKELPDGCVDLVVTDPPFFNPSAHYISRDKRKAKRSYGDMSIMKIAFRQIASELSRVTKQKGHSLMFCDCVTYPTFFEAHYDYFDYVRSLIWYKGKNYFSLGKGAWRYSYEMILHAFNTNQFYVQLNRQDFIECRNVRNQEKNHQAEKPVELVENLIHAVTNSSGVVLDPFLGSGTTAVAAKRLARHYIGIEINSDYCRIAEERLAQEMLL